MIHNKEKEDKDYFDLIDITYIYNEEIENDPILKWLQENREPIID